MISRYWNNSHPLCPLAEKLTADFIPERGHASYVEAEVYRAACRIHYDYYNNGGGNNMSQQVAYIRGYHVPGNPRFLPAFDRIATEALEPMGDTALHDDFEVFLTDILCRLRDADITETLTPIDLETADMPWVEVKYQEDTDDAEDMATG